MELQRKQLDPLVVRFTATALILAEGSTTTMAVKKALRQRGYEARQADVSQWLFVISLWENWTFDDSGAHRVFHFPRFAPSLQ
ncbi:hypothetical protein [Spirosoma lituiforme]